MSGHTPGEWALRIRGGECTIVVRDHLPGRIVIAEVEVGPQRSANARLIAAAPDLLATCRDFVALYDGLRDAIGPSVREKLARADAAIAKADGIEVPQ